MSIASNYAEKFFTRLVPGVLGKESFSTRLDFIYEKIHKFFNRCISSKP